MTTEFIPGALVSNTIYHSTSLFIVVEILPPGNTRDDIYDARLYPDYNKFYPDYGKSINTEHGIVCIHLDSRFDPNANNLLIFRARDVSHIETDKYLCAKRLVRLREFRTYYQEELEAAQKIVAEYQLKLEITADLESKL